MINTVSEALLVEAEARWRRVLSGRPDLEPAVTLQRRLIGRTIEAIGSLERGAPVPWSLAPDRLVDKLNRGIPALRGEVIPVPVDVLAPLLAEFAAWIAEGGGGDAALHVSEAIAGRRIDAGSWLGALLRRDQVAVRSGALQIGLSPDLVWLVGELAVAPFAHQLDSGLFEDPSAAAAVARWDHGYCPTCGSWPALVELSEGRRLLRCSFCGRAWNPPAEGCAYCSERSAGFSTITPDAARPGRRIELCDGCGGYLKQVEVARAAPFPLVAIEDLETSDLDVTAMNRDYQRPPLADLGSDASARPFGCPATAPENR